MVRNKILDYLPYTGCCYIMLFQMVVYFGGPKEW